MESTMDASLFLLLFALAGAGLFFVIRMALRPLLLHLTHGPLSTLYLDFIKKNTRLQVDAAYQEYNADRANAQLVFAKIEEMGNPRVSYAKREQNLKYIKAYALINRKLSEELIKVLPKQQRNIDFQAKLSAYICEVLNKLKEDTGTERNNVPDPTNQRFIEAWSLALAAWLAGSAFFIASMYTWDSISVPVVFLINLALFITMLIPLFFLIFSGFAKITGIVTIGTAILIGMGLFAQYNHQGSQQQEINLESYNQTGTVIINHPYWISANEMETCPQAKNFSFYVTKQPQAELITFDVPPGLQIKDAKCSQDVSPSFELHPPHETINFRLATLDQSMFNNDPVNLFARITIAGQEVVLDDDPITVRLEHWAWQLVSNLLVQWGSFSTAGLLLVLKIFVFNKPQV